MACKVLLLLEHLYESGDEIDKDDDDNVVFSCQTSYHHRRRLKTIKGKFNFIIPFKQRKLLKVKV